MNKRQSNKLNSHRRVKGVLKKKIGYFSDVPVYLEPLNSYFAMMDEIEQVVKRTGLDTTGETEKKRQTKEAMCDKAVALASAGLLYAYDIASPELENGLSFTHSDLITARDNDALKFAMVIEEELNNHADVLEAYQISADDLAALHALIEQFKNASEEQGDVKTESIADTSRFEVLLNSIDELLKRKIDRIVSRMKPDKPKFFEQYQSARMIIDV